MKTLNIKKIALVLSLILLTPLTFAHRGGNGGSDLEIDVEIITRKIYKFLDTPTGKSEFYDIKIENLFELKNQLNVVATTETLIDRCGIERTALNFPNENKILINEAKWEKLKEQEQTKFILVFHEMLGLIGEEAVCGEDTNKYDISVRLLPFIQVVHSFELVEEPNKQVWPGFHCVIKDSKAGRSLFFQAHAGKARLLLYQHNYTRRNSMSFYSEEFPVNLTEFLLNEKQGFGGAKAQVITSKGDDLIFSAFWNENSPKNFFSMKLNGNTINLEDGYCMKVNFTSSYFTTEGTFYGITGSNEGEKLLYNTLKWIKKITR
jgi:hypothetical protein